MDGHFEFDLVEQFQGASSIETSHLFYSNGLATYHSLPNIGYVKISNGSIAILSKKNVRCIISWNVAFCFIVEV